MSPQPLAPMNIYSFNDDSGAGGASSGGDDRVASANGGGGGGGGGRAKSPYGLPLAFTDTYTTHTPPRRVGGGIEGGGGYGGVYGGKGWGSFHEETRDLRAQLNLLSCKLADADARCAQAHELRQEAEDKVVSICVYICVCVYIRVYVCVHVCTYVYRERRR